MIQDEFEYHMRRADEHWRLARAAISPEKRSIHRRIAEAYVRIAQKSEHASRWTHITSPGTVAGVH